MRHRVVAAVAMATVLAAAIVVIGLPESGNAADHLDAPGLTPPSGNLMADSADLYVFAPGNMSADVAMILTVNPAAGVFGPAGFDPTVDYDFNIDTDGDALADTVFTFRFDELQANGRQAYRVLRDGEEVASARTGTPAQFESSNGRALAGLFDDPFFFDLDAFTGSGGRAFCDGGENDFFAGLNVNAMIVELPVADLADGTIGVWASTHNADGQIDRVGFPAINTVFIQKGRKNAYNLGQPADDPANFQGRLRRIFEASGNDAATARALADALQPDILGFDPSVASGFLNGRRPIDDVIDAELGLLTAGALTTDCVDANDVAFGDTFPWLAEAH